jgi:hypothetical protein
MCFFSANIPVNIFMSVILKVRSEKVNVKTEGLEANLSQFHFIHVLRGMKQPRTRTSALRDRRLTLTMTLPL